MVNFIQNYWLTITLFLLAVIVTASLLPGSSLPSVAGSDKVHHAIAYAALMLPTALKKPKYWLVIAFALLCLSGVIELIQPYVNRNADWLDLLANAGGILCGIIVAKVMKYFLVNPIESLQ